MTISEAFAQGIYKLHKAVWAFADDRIELQVEGGHYGPWATLVSPSCERRGRPELARQEVMILGDTADDWLEWREPQFG